MVKAMAKRRVRFTFPEQLITEPLIYNLGRKFEIVTNIRRANVQERVGWVVLELEGDDDEIDRGMEWMTAAGVRVDSVTGDLIEG